MYDKINTGTQLQKAILACALLRNWIS